MMTALISFLGGSAFRLLFGGVMDWLNRRQEHKAEVELLQVQAKLDADRHIRDMEAIRLQVELNVKEIHAAADAAEQGAMASAFVEAVKGTQVKTGVRLVDAWNACIRPAGASFALAIWIMSVVAAYFAADAVSVAQAGILTEFDKTLISAFLGVFVGERIHKSIR